MILLLDIGNTHSHLGLARDERIIKQINIPTPAWFLSGSSRSAARLLHTFIGKNSITGAALCSVVPSATPLAKKLIANLWHQECLILSPKTLRGVGIDYPRPATIGPDRLANAVAVKQHYGAPAIVVDFGTAVTFDVVDRSGSYIGGIIAPGLNVMTDYLHEKTALLPRVKIRDLAAVVGKNTEQAMLIGAVHGYRGLIRELIKELKAELRVTKLPVVATGGYAALIAQNFPKSRRWTPTLLWKGCDLFGPRITINSADFFKLNFAK